MTFEFIAFSDVHWHPFSFGATFEECKLDYVSGERVLVVNSRLLDIYKQLNHMMDYVDKHNINVVVFCGDWFHLKENVPKSVLAIAERFKARLQAGDLLMIPGNHDYEDKNGTTHSLLPYADRASTSVLDFQNPAETVLITDYKNSSSAFIKGIPYTEDRDLLLRELNTPINLEGYENLSTICLFHAGVQGAQVGSDFILKKSHDISADEVKKDNHSIYLAGHYHQHQKLWDNAWMVGAPLQMEWSDAGGKRGFMHIKIEDDGHITAKHIPTDPSIPKFHKFNSLEELLESDVQPHDFVKVKVSEDITEDFVSRVKGFLQAKLGDVPAYLEFIPAAKKEELKEDIITDAFTSTEALLTEWIDRESPKLDKEKLLALGAKFISKAKELADD